MLFRSEAPPPSAGQRLDRWLQASARYLATRESLIAGLGEGGRSRYLDCVFQRDQVMRTGDGGMPDVFGQRRGMDRETFSWPIVVHQPKALTGNLENIGPDGACLALPTAPPPGQALHASVQGETLRGELVFEARWQRRVAKDRWLVGVCTTACRVHEPPG